MKRVEGIVEILEAFDLTGSYRAAAELASCSHHTVAPYVRMRATKAMPAFWFLDASWSSTTSNTTRLRPNACNTQGSSCPLTKGCQRTDSGHGNVDGGGHEPGR